MNDWLYKNVSLQTILNIIVLVISITFFISSNSSELSAVESRVCKAEEALLLKVDKEAFNTFVSDIKISQMEMQRDIKTLIRRVK